MADAALQPASALERVEQILATRIGTGAIDVPVLPKAASEVLRLSNDASADAAKLSQMIHQDQALAAHVLRIANSPAYMPRSPIVSLQHAVAMLGMTQLCEIALSISLKSGAVQAPGHESDIKQLWRHALASGLFAKEIARRRRLNVENAYLCGLLHTIGKPVVMQAILRIAKECAVTVKADALMTCMEHYHTKVGTLVADRWSLPKAVAAAIAYYQHYEMATEHRQDAMITCLADRLATALIAPDTFDDATLRDHPVFADLNLYPPDVDALLGLKDQILQTVDAMAV